MAVMKYMRVAQILLGVMLVCVALATTQHLAVTAPDSNNHGRAASSHVPVVAAQKPRDAAFIKNHVTTKPVVHAVEAHNAARPSSRSTQAVVPSSTVAAASTAVSRGTRVVARSRIRRTHAHSKSEPGVVAARRQCGGNGGNCKKYGDKACADRPFAGLQCEVGTMCVRVNAAYYQCLSATAAEASIAPQPTKVQVTKTAAAKGSSSAAAKAKPTTSTKDTSSAAKPTVLKPSPAQQQQGQQGAAARAVPASSKAAQKARKVSSPAATTAATRRAGAGKTKGRQRAAGATARNRQRL